MLHNGFAVLVTSTENATQPANGDTAEPIVTETVKIPCNIKYRSTEFTIYAGGSVKTARTSIYVDDSTLHNLQITETKSASRVRLYDIAGNITTEREIVHQQIASIFQQIIILAE